MKHPCKTYVLGDLTKAQYIMRRQALEEELQRLGPPAIDQARAILGVFPRFWDLETRPAERRKLLLSLFEQSDGGRTFVCHLADRDTALKFARRP
jgi:hypothetical protein